LGYRRPTMLLADTHYPLLNVVWSMIVFFAWILWIWLLIYVYMDIFRRDDIGGWGKFGWVVFTIFLPFIGVFTYLIVEGKGMDERKQKDVRQAQADTDNYIRSVAHNGNSSADQIAQANQLLNSGAITQDEYQALKAKALAG
ncbi:MAG TPA: SHOCT domain-containing protein, partial [Jatrophihabitans sp.]